MKLVRPTSAMLPAYRDALQRGFLPHNTEQVRLEQLRQLDEDPYGLIALTHDPEGKGPPFVRPDGSQQARLPGITRWMWHDGADGGPFVGAINLRWQAGTSALPPKVPGHIGYTVCAWHRGKGHGTVALIAILAEAQQIGLDHVLLTVDEDNTASRRTIEKAGGACIGPFEAGALLHPDVSSLLYRIDL
ncbi:GNAT family N-acetyltransferase [Croceicoccus naphthovorans]|uniref:Uncharacterized protein n=1 Tax=Croceicoccus naphthovorans TaxID=1348774 RepID=A0A0G3XLJ0_9SPHN|nr:GNAT family N-acetyltransferase [Croceicoccus naphthovorans]AKM11298.1 hypothetical protein AB433_17045 [Croceicoccus naphthovorans]MBB3989779.1 RimJ/RimL family protein N-acetyltransferase [Croceicoccus naphthovorans]